MSEVKLYDIKRKTEIEPCSDVVSRQAVLSRKIYTETEEGWSGYTVDADYIEHLPSVTVRQTSTMTSGYIDFEPIDERNGIRQTGEWKEVYAETDYRNGWIEFTCPNCEYQHGLESGEYGWSYGDPIPWKYCPICGMEVKEEINQG